MEKYYNDKIKECDEWIERFEFFIRTLREEAFRFGDSDSIQKKIKFYSCELEKAIQARREYARERQKHY